MAGSKQLWPPVTINRIIQTLIYRLAMHPLINNPPVWDDQGNQIIINKFRNYDGYELENPGGLTLSVFPYHYASSDTGSSLTCESKNAAIVYKPYTLGNRLDYPNTVDEACANIVLKLNYFAYDREETDDRDINTVQDTIFDFNYAEWLLRQYTTLVSHALRGSDMRTLPRFPDKLSLLANSFVNYEDYPTSRWEKKGNLILHSASILWQTKYYAVREWQNPPQYVPVDMNDGVFLIGTIPDGQGGQENIYYDSVRNLFQLSDGVTNLQRSQLNDPSTSQAYLTIDPDLISLIDSAPNTLNSVSLYYKLNGSTP